MTFKRFFTTSRFHLKKYLSTTPPSRSPLKHDLNNNNENRKDNALMLSMILALPPTLILLAAFKIENDQEFESKVSQVSPAFVRFLAPVRFLFANSKPKTPENPEQIAAAITMQQEPDRETIQANNYNNNSSNIVISNESSDSNSFKNDPSENDKAAENVSESESQFDENEAKQIIHEKEEIIPQNENNQVITYPSASYTSSPVIDYSQLASVPAEIRAKEFKHDIANVFFYILHNITL